MRFKLTLQVLPEVAGNVLPLNYQYELSAAIYKVLAKSDQEYAFWLHENGYKADGEKKFKLFSFSRLMIPQWQIPRGTDRLRIQSEEVEWFLSFLPDKSTEKFVQGIFANQRIAIGDKKSCVQFIVKGVEGVPAPAIQEEMMFEAISPMTLRCWHADTCKSEYISPADPRAPKAILTGLLSRYKAINGVEFHGDVDYQYEVLDKPKSALIKIKADTPYQTFVRGYMCRFKIRVPQPLMRILYESGAGELCSQGFGFVREIKPPTENDWGLVRLK